MITLSNPIQWKVVALANPNQWKVAILSNPSQWKAVTLSYPHQLKLVTLWKVANQSNPSLWKVVTLSYPCHCKAVTLSNMIWSKFLQENYLTGLYRSRQIFSNNLYWTKLHVFTKSIGQSNPFSLNYHNNFEHKTDFFNA